MIADWRRQFEAPLLPFLVVQLPNYRAHRAEPGPSAWAEIRNHQRLAVAGDTAAALVPTLGLGSETDVHPSEKQEVGRRLARAADNVAYGMPDAPKGVVPFEASLDAGTVTVSFDNVVGQLVSFGGQQVLSFEVCADAQPGCRFADARITGPSTVAIEADGPVDKVRFGWSDNPMINLADATGMLIGSFEITVASK
jgi:sialate O-acetylesterase